LKKEVKKKTGLRERRTKRPLWVRVLGGVFYLGVLGVALGIGTVGGTITRSPVLSAMVRNYNRPPEQVFAGKDSITLLLLGCDQDVYYRGTQVLNEAARSDMILVAKVDFKKKIITGLSIPRDTVVRLPGYRLHKINAYHAMGGKDREKAKELATRAVQEVLPNVPIDRTIVLNYSAFQEVVDMVGGVRVKVDRKLKYEDKAGGIDIDLEPGWHTLDGYTAMCYVRFRKNDAGRALSDFERQENQREFLLSFKNTVMAQPLLVGAVADKAVDVLDGALSAEETAVLALFSRQVPASQIKMGQIPVYDSRRISAGLEVDVSKLEETLREHNLLPDEQVATR